MCDVFVSMAPSVESMKPEGWEEMFLRLLLTEL